MVFYFIIIKIAFIQTCCTVSVKVGGRVVGVFSLNRRKSLEQIWSWIQHFLYKQKQFFRGVLKKVFLEISQKSQENTRERVSFLIATLLEKRLWHRYFPVNFAKFLGTPFLTEHLRWLLLYKIFK